MKYLKYIFSVMILVTVSCSRSEVNPVGQIDTMPPIYPDYTEVTMPKNLVSPRFWIPDSCGAQAVQAVFTSGDVKFVVNGSKRRIELSESQFTDLYNASSTINVQIYIRKDDKWLAYKPFNIYVAPEEIDKFIAYRLIEPGYESWDEMGIYQRCLENYRQEPIITNRETNYGCMNCHSFCKADPEKWLMHLRVDYPGTYIIEGDEITKLNTKTPDNISALVYPSWHPSGRYVAFSVNDTKQMFHTTDPNRIEVYDNASDVVVYDVENHEILSSPLTKSPTSFETFATFSADGETLYFCTADSVDMPKGYERLKYNICSISFDPQTRKFGTEVDTIYNAVSDDASASFPRVSPDGRFLMFTKAKYGTFSIWHRDADLYMIDLTTCQVKPVDILNSDETESYHTWSSNGRWVVFSSRRLDGLYTRPYFAYIDANGNAHKPVLLPPPTEEYYDRLMKSYNVPEFITNMVELPPRAISNVAKSSPGINLTSR